MSRCQLWRLVKEGKFPAPMELSLNAIGWPAEEIENWKRNRPRRTYGRQPQEAGTTA